MKALSTQEILELGKKHKKWYESTTVDIFPYLINNNRYYLAYYHGKFNMDVKACTIVSPDSFDKKEALEALEPLVYFTIPFSKLESNTQKRAELPYDVYEEIQNYLKQILDAQILDRRDEVVYQRSYEIMTNMIHQQEEMKGLWEQVKAIMSRINSRGYFIDSEIDEALEYFPTPGWIQYQQFKDRYEYRKDFDLIYEKRKDPILKPFGRYIDEKTLQHMTSAVAEKDLKDSIDLVTDGKDMSTISKEEYHEYWRTKFKEQLEERLQELKQLLRFR